MKSYSDISYRYIEENKKRTILTILGITLATVLLFAIGTFLFSLRDSLLDAYRADGNYEFILSDLDKEKSEKLIKNAEIKDSFINASENDTIYSIEEINNQEITASITRVSSEYYNNILNPKIREGRLPKTKNEAIISTQEAKAINAKINSTFNIVDSEGNKQSVKIVGIYKTETYISGYNNITFIETLDRMKNNYDYTVFVNLKSDKNKQEIIKNVMKKCNIEEKSMQGNSFILYLTGNGSDEITSKAIANIAIFVIAIIIVCTITVVYNSFNISVIERIRYFGILKAIGASGKQIKRIIYKEGIIMGLISLPLGCLIGFLALKFGTMLFLDNEFLSMDLKIRFYPIIILFTLLVLSVTIWLSLLAPARKAKKISAVTAMRSGNEIKVGKIKKRKNRIIGKLFGIEGSIAYKNIRRTPFRFIITVIALTISIVMFNVFYGFMDYAKQIITQQVQFVPFDAQLNKEGYEQFTADEISEIKEHNYSKEMKEYYSKTSSCLLENDKFNEEYNKETGYQGKGVELIPGYSEVTTGMYSCKNTSDLEFANKYVVEGKIDNEKFQNNGVILYDGIQIRDKDGNKKSYRITNYKVGDKIKISKSINCDENGNATAETRNENNFYEVEIMAICNKDPFQGGVSYGQISIIYSDKTYNSLVESVNPNVIDFTFDDDEGREKQLDYYAENAEKLGFNYIDMTDQVKEINTFYNQMEFFVYCFIIAITIISVVNIFNTISTNLLLRRKEFSTMKAIGMTKKQLRKSIILEGTLYGIIAAIFGGIISIGLLYFLIKIGGGLIDVEYHFGFGAFILSIIVAILITYISTLVPLRKISKTTIVEGISGDE